MIMDLQFQISDLVLDREDNDSRVKLKFDKENN
jgi:hypothetical protein